MYGGKVFSIVGKEMSRVWALVGVYVCVLDSLGHDIYWYLNVFLF